MKGLGARLWELAPSPFRPAAVGADAEASPTLPHGKGCAVHYFSGVWELNHVGAQGLNVPR